MNTIPQWIKNLHLFAPDEERNSSLFEGEKDYQTIKRLFCLYMVKDFKESLKEQLTGDMKIFIDFTISSLESNAPIADFESIARQTSHWETQSLPSVMGLIFSNDSQKDFLIDSLPHIIADKCANGIKLDKKGMNAFFSEDPILIENETRQIKNRKILEYRNELIRLLKV